MNYFTRIEKPDEITAWKCLTFAKDFHAKALDQSDEDTLSMYLEPGEESDNTTYQTVNIHSDITHIQWGDLNPEIVGDVQWSLKESNSVYTSILAKYQVRCQDDKEETARYNVKEFFRIRSVGDTIYLLDYNRDLQEVFSSSRSVMDQRVSCLESCQKMCLMRQIKRIRSLPLCRTVLCGCIIRKMRS